MLITTRQRQALGGKGFPRVGKAQRHPSVRDPKLHTKTTFPILMQRIANNIRCRFTSGEIERETPLLPDRQLSHLLGKPLRQR